MEFADVSQQVEWEVRRVATAFQGQMLLPISEHNGAYFVDVSLDDPEALAACIIEHEEAGDTWRLGQIALARNATTKPWI